MISKGSQSSDNFGKVCWPCTGIYDKSETLGQREGLQLQGGPRVRTGAYREVCEDASPQGQHSRCALIAGTSKGFTLIEVLIAMVILSIALLAITGMFITGVDGVSFGDRITSVVTLAQEKMEELMGLDYSDPTFWDGGSEEIGTITRIWEVKRDDPFPGMATIRVSVSWRDKSNKPRNIALVTMKAK